MKYYVFKRESNKFDDILKDVAVKPIIRYKIKFKYHLILGFADDDEKILSYMTIKYGDDMISFSDIVPDRTPIMGKDYTPIRRDKKVVSP
jgi:hypothetical protein